MIIRREGFSFGSTKGMFHSKIYIGSFVTVLWYILKYKG